MAHAAQRILVTGATGFVGRHVVRELLRGGFMVRGLLRKPEGAAMSGVEWAVGDVGRPETLGPAMSGCDGVIHLVGIIAERKGVTFESVHVEGTRHVVAAARAAGVRRYVQMSALGTRANAVATYHKTKWAAEELVRASGLAWTIFRPSLIHGADGEFMQMMRGWALGEKPPFFFMPYFGEGLLGQHNPHRIAPVFVDDVAAAFVGALEKPETVGKTYDLTGPDDFTWPQMLHAVSRIVRGRTKAAVGIPAWWATMLASLPLPLPFNKDQVIMSQEENVGDMTAVRRDFPEIAWHGFVETVARYKDELRKKQDTAPATGRPPG